MPATTVAFRQVCSMVFPLINDDLGFALLGYAPRGYYHGCVVGSRGGVGMDGALIDRNSAIVKFPEEGHVLLVVLAAECHVELHGEWRGSTGRRSRTAEGNIRRIYPHRDFACRFLCLLVF